MLDYARSLCDICVVNYPCVFAAVLTQDIPHIFAMTIFEEYIYWSDWETKSINRAHKTLGTNKTMLISTLHRPMDIHIYHPSRQPEGQDTLLHTAAKDTLHWLKPA